MPALLNTCKFAKILPLLILLSIFKANRKISQKKNYFYNASTANSSKENYYYLYQLIQESLFFQTLQSF